MLRFAKKFNPIVDIYATLIELVVVLPECSKHGWLHWAEAFTFLRSNYGDL